MRVLLVGAYGFIGSGIARSLISADHEVIGLGRSIAIGQRILPQIGWIAGDLNYMVRSSDWTSHLLHIDAVINASGALQDGGGDRLTRVQGESIAALIAACEEARIARFIQISAPGASPTSGAAFLETKAFADDRLRASTLSWAILRPGLVIGRNAYGGTLLLRGLAASPIVQPLAYGDRHIQSVALADVAATVLRCLDRDSPCGIDIDLVERSGLTLRQTIERHRQWLGIAPARLTIDLPPQLASVTSFAADLVGHLGWRSPLRSTAMSMIARDVRGDPQGAEALLGRPLLDLDQTLSLYPAGLQDRWQARLVLLLPLIIGVLALLFFTSGLIGLVRLEDVTAQLHSTPVAGTVARWLGITGSFADLALGLAILVRRHARAATFGMALLTLVYVIMGSWLRPDMWIDPLAPLTKAAAVMVLALVAHALLEDR